MSKVTESSVDPEVVNIARGAYKAYIANSEGKSWDGKPCPAWEALTPAVRGHWCAAVLRMFDEMRAHVKGRVGELETRCQSLQAQVVDMQGRLDAFVDERSCRLGCRRHRCRWRRHRRLVAVLVDHDQDGRRRQRTGEVGATLASRALRV